MSNYFSKFPLMQYNEIFVRDITRRNNFVEQNLSNPYLFLPYTVKENEKPEDIAYDYYGTVDATWLILLANNIIDPYGEWYKSEEHFNEYLIKKYEKSSGKKGYDVLAWAQNETIFENILFFEKDA